MKEPVPEKPLSREDGLAILELLQEVNVDLKRLNKALFGEAKPEDPEDRYSAFGHAFGVMAQDRRERIDKLIVALRGSAGPKDA